MLRLIFDVLLAHTGFMRQVEISTGAISSGLALVRSFTAPACCVRRSCRWLVLSDTPDDASAAMAVPSAGHTGDATTVRPLPSRQLLSWGPDYLGSFAGRLIGKPSVGGGRCRGGSSELLEGLAFPLVVCVQWHGLSGMVFQRSVGLHGDAKLPCVFPTCVVG